MANSFTVNMVGFVLIRGRSCPSMVSLTAATIRALALVFTIVGGLVILPSRVDLTAAVICALALVFTIVGGLDMLVALSINCS